MSEPKIYRPPNKAKIITEQAIGVVERFLHIQASSGVVLLIAAAAALIWANSPYADLYVALWHMPLSISFGSLNFSYDLHFWVNDILMTVFFLVAGMEIRREIHEGALSDIRQATLPIIAAIGGVILPAVIYIMFNSDPARHHGWAVPTATDIAFAVGILALLGRSIPRNVRVVLLSLAIIDDIAAVLIIAFFYSNAIDPNGLLLALFGIALVLFMQWIGIGSAWFYIAPAAIIWFGLFQTGAHPSLAGVVLGLMTPVLPGRTSRSPLDMIQKGLTKLQNQSKADDAEGVDLVQDALRDLRMGQREILPPVTRVQMALHPWVAFVIMPLFAFANAGVSFGGVDFSEGGSIYVFIGVTLGLLVGKPLGIFLASFIAVKLKLCKLPPQVDWSGILLVGLLAGVGFTMAIFVGMLAFDNPNQLDAAKIGILTGSFLSATIGLIYGVFYLRKIKRQKIV